MASKTKFKETMDKVDIIMESYGENIKEQEKRAQKIMGAKEKRIPMLIS